MSCKGFILMKRLLNVAGGLFSISIFPILSWLILAILLNQPHLSNVFALTYPLQFIWIFLKSAFGTGANIKKIKEKKENAVYSSIVFCLILSFAIFGLVALFVDDYIAFMNLEVNIYRELALYAIANLFLQLMFALIMEKLYFENKEKSANLHSLLFNLLAFISLIVPALITPNLTIIISIALSVSFIYILSLYIWQFKKFKFDFNILTNFKYESATLLDALFMLIIYLFGFRNAFSYGEEYVIAINFVALITDAQYDGLSAISTVAKIEIAEDNYLYKKALARSFVLGLIANLISIILFFSLFNVYNVNLTIGIIYLVLQITSSFIYCLNANLSAFIQLNHSFIKNTANKLFSKFARVGLAFLPTPYCNETALVSSDIILLVACLIIRFKYYTLKDGKLIEKSSLT